MVQKINSATILCGWLSNVNHFKDKIDAVYEYINTYLKIEDDGDLNKYISIEL